jgi:hypothetical protein
VLSIRIVVPAALLACSVLPLAAQGKPGKFENRSLAVMSLAGQKVPLLPLTMVLADPAIEGDSAYGPWRERAAALRRADSLIVLELTNRGPEISWVTPYELRKQARRAPGMLSSPDELGQAMLRAEKITRVPDQLASALRKLVAISGGRMVMVPAALSFSRPADAPWRADLMLALVDTRRYEVVWRSTAMAHGDSPDLALRSALTTVFPQ